VIKLLAASKLEVFITKLLDAEVLLPALPWMMLFIAIIRHTRVWTVFEH
jgi:hypothetical protein